MIGWIDLFVFRIVISAFAGLTGVKYEGDGQGRACERCPSIGMQRSINLKL